jgi:hypothetical protein
MRLLLAAIIVACLFAPPASAGPLRDRVKGAVERIHDKLEEDRLALRKRVSELLAERDSLLVINLDLRGRLGALRAELEVSHEPARCTLPAPVEPLKTCAKKGADGEVVLDCKG